MKLPGLDKLPGMERMMEQMQQKQAEIQRAMESARLEGSSGGGIVTVTMNGMKHVVSVRIDPEAMSDREMLQDLLAAAINEAGRRADENAQRQMSDLMGGLNLGGLKIPGLS
jgi:DNA-binding YbaB/EbfC family protein